MANSPFFSIIVPIMDQNVHLLAFTMDSIVGQAFGSFEIIILDGQSKKASHPFFHAYHPRIARIYNVTDCNLSAMLNKGIDLSKGTYLHFLLPGEFYISRHSFKFLKDFIEQNSSPDLVYTGSIVRHSLSPPQQLFRQIEKEDLKGAEVPQTLQAYWFKKHALLTCGKFNPIYGIQSGFDLICRFYQHPTLHKAFMRRILTDYEYRLPKPRWIIQQLYETLLIIFRHFGFSKAVLFWIAQNHLRLIRWWSKNIKGAFWKHSSIE